jgi:glycerophosphoryl diester phosphodiesterase
VPPVLRPAVPLAVLAVAVAGLAAPAAAGAVAAVHARGGAPVADGVPIAGEATMSAYRKAWRSYGAVLEIPARLTADGVPVVLEDPALDRTTPCSGLVARRAALDLAACPVDMLGHPAGPLPAAGAERPEPIPTLADALLYARDAGATVSLEIANRPGEAGFDTGEAFAGKVMDAVVASGLPLARIIVRATAPADLDVARRRLPGVATALVTRAAENAGGPALAAGRGDAWLVPEWPVDGAYVATARAAGRLVAPSVLDTPADVQAAAGLGVDAVVTDDLPMARRALGLPVTAPTGSDPLPPPGPPALDLMFGPLASDTYTSTRMRLRWRGHGPADAQATGFHAVIRARGQRRTADWRVLRNGTSDRHAVFTGASGATYDVRVRAVDPSGALGPVAATRLIVPFDDRDSGLRRTGAWQRVAAPGAWRGSVRVARRAGPAMRLRLRGRAVRVIAPLTADGGRLEVGVDGRRRTVSLRGPAADRQVVFAARGLGYRTHRVTLRARGSGPVAVDAVAPG